MPAWKTALTRVGRALWRPSSERIFWTNLDAPAGGEPPGAPVDLIDVNAGNVERLFGSAPGGLTGEVAAARLRSGERGLVARIGDDVVAHCWFTRGPWRLRDVGLEIRLEPDDGILYDAYTAPAQRRLGIMALLVREQAARARTQGWHRVFARAAAANLNSKSTLLRGGLSEVLILNATVVGSAVGILRVDVIIDDPSVVEWFLRSMRAFHPGWLTWNWHDRRGARIVTPWVAARSGT